MTRKHTPAPVALEVPAEQVPAADELLEVRLRVSASSLTALEATLPAGGEIRSVGSVAQICALARQADEEEERQAESRYTTGVELRPGLLRDLSVYAHQPNACDGDFSFPLFDGLAADMTPKDPVQAMISTMMIHAFQATSEAIGRSMTRTLSPMNEHRAAAEDATCERWARVAVAHQNAFTRLAEVWGRLRGSIGTQTVKVEHVNVSAGGQAVVGNVNRGGGQ
jgi:hypothetical protein